MSEKIETPIVAYKGFNKDWKCRDYQFAVGESFEHDGPVRRCSSGINACEYPLDVFGYYPPSEGNRFAIVEMSGEVCRGGEGDDTKIASGRLHVKA